MVVVVVLVLVGKQARKSIKSNKSENLPSNQSDQANEQSEKASNVHELHLRGGAWYLLSSSDSGPSNADHKRQELDSGEMVCASGALDTTLTGAAATAAAATAGKARQANESNKQARQANVQTNNHTRKSVFGEPSEVINGRNQTNTKPNVYHPLC